jgi:phosphatidyl-myo-inositol alpha-mannosyltransferase
MAHDYAFRSVPIGDDRGRRGTGRAPSAPPPAEGHASFATRGDQHLPHRLPRLHPHAPAPHAHPHPREGLGREALGRAATSGTAVGLRVALVTEYFPPHVGGIGEHVLHLAREARCRGAHADIVTSNLAGAHPEAGVIRIGESAPVYANGSMARVTVGRGLRRTVRELLERGRYDLVHVHAPLTPSLPILFVEEASALGIPIVGTFHAYFERSLAYFFGRRFFQGLLDRLQAAICVSPAARDAVARYFDADWTIIPNGVDTERFTPDAPRPASVRPDVPAITFVGRFDPRNGLDALVEAYRLVRQRGTRAQLVIVGDGPERERYVTQAAGLDGVTFAGRVPAEALPGYYAAAAVYACPTVLGSFGITLLEAMATARPVVCYDTSGFRSVVRDGVEALMTPVGDVPALADALERVLADEALRRRMGQAGRQRAAGYAWPAVADAVLGVYARLVATASLAA